MLENLEKIDWGALEDAYGPSTRTPGLIRALAASPDIVLLDIDMPGLLAFDAVRTIRTRCPSTRIVVLSGFFHDRYIEEALAAEASGYMTKSEPAEAVVKAVRTVAASPM